MTTVRRKADCKVFFVIEEKEVFGEIFVLLKSVDGEVVLLTLQDALRRYELDR